MMLTVSPNQPAKKQPTMNINDNPEKAAEYLRQVIPMLTKHKVPATPVNYSVWYSYVSGQQLALNEAINNTLEQGKPITSEFCNELYEAYVDGSAMISAQEEIQKKLSKIVTQTIQNVGEACKEAETFDQTLNQRSTQLDQVSDNDSLQMLISQMTTDTRKMAENGQSLQNQMHETKSEVEQLRQELDQVKQAARQDSLTGLSNRGSFDEHMEILTQLPANNSHPGCLMMLDIDHFKRINDNFGHLVGDRVIKYVAALLKQVVGENQIIARYGGEEFAVVMKDTPYEVVLKLAEKIRIGLSKSKLQRKESGETIGQITISIGVTKQQEDDTPERFIERADAALYKAKNGGRDQVVHDDS